MISRTISNGLAVLIVWYGCKWGTESFSVSQGIYPWNTDYFQATDSDTLQFVFNA